jgi:hypothetical protein
MDPNLESNRLWRGVHHLLISGLNAQLNSLLPPPYVARIEERVYIQEELRNIYPDVAVARRPSTDTYSSLATLERPRSSGQTTSVRIPLPSQRVREAFLEIFLVGDTERLITVVEVLSPTNKIPGTGWDEYRRKQRELQERGINLLEIDLLRYGAETVLAPMNVLREQGGTWDYLVSLYRAMNPGECEVWAISLRNTLPVVTVPLTGGTPEVAVDLQSILNRVYDEGAFGRSIDYTIEPEIPLAEIDRAWADTLLHAAGMR